MMDFLAPAAVLFAALIGSIINEAYKRHRDMQAVAAALAGEIRTHTFALENMWQPILQGWVKQLEQGVPLRKMTFEKPADRIYAASIGKIGLLPQACIPDIVMFYESLAGLRTSLMLLLEDAVDYGPDVQKRCAAQAKVIQDRAQMARFLVGLSKDSIVPMLNAAGARPFGAQHWQMATTFVGRQIG